MSQNQYLEAHQFIIKIILIKLKIKFPCKMSLEINNIPIINQPKSSESNIFYFSQVAKLKSNGEQSNIQLSVVLYTQKGTKYISGVAKLIKAELIRSKGQRIIIPLTKCLDPDAFCEIIVQSIEKNGKGNVQSYQNKNLPSINKAMLFSPQKKDARKITINETKSEVNASKHVGYTNLRIQQYGYHEGPKSQAYKTFTKSPNNKNYANKNIMLNTNISKLKSEFPLQSQQLSNAFPASNLLQTEVYREGYQKLKEKFKRESEVAKEENHKRLALEANQNSYKLQIMRLKLKCEQNQKLLIQKTEKHRQLNSQLMEFQKKDLDLDYLKQQNQSLQHRLKISDEKIIMLGNDISSLKLLMQQKSELHKENLQALKQELDTALIRCEQIKSSSEMQLKAKQSNLVNKDNDLRIRNQFIERQRKIIKELQEQAQIKMFEYQKIISNQRNIAQTKNQEFKNKILLLQSVIIQIKVSQKQAIEQQQKLQNTIIALQYTNKIRQQQIQAMNLQICEYRQIKDKDNQLQKQNISRLEELSSLKKHLESSLEEKAVTLNGVISRYTEEKNRYIQQKQQIQNNLKISSNKIKEMELKLQQQDYAYQKEVRKNEQFSKELHQLRQSNKVYIQSNRLLSIQVLQLQQFHKPDPHLENTTFYQQKIQSQKQELLNETQKMKDMIVVNEEKLKQAIIKNKQLKICISQAQQKIQKLQKINKSNLKQLQNQLKDHEQHIEQWVNKSKAKDQEIKQLKNKSYQYELLLIKNQESLQKEKKVVKIIEEKLINHEKVSKQKINQLQTLSIKYQNLENFSHDKQNQKTRLMAQKQQISVLLSKKQKMLDMVNRDLCYARNEIESFKKTVRQKESEEQLYRFQIKEKGQQCEALKIKLIKVEKEYIKFKQFMAQLVKSQFAKINTLHIEKSRNTDQRLNDSRISVVKSQASQKHNIETAYLMSLIQQKLQETKKNMCRMIQTNKLLKQQNNKLMQRTQEQSNKYEFAQLELHRDIQLLQNQVSSVMNDKQIQSENYDNLMMELSSKIKDKQTQNQDLRLQIEKYQTIIEGLKNDIHQTNETNDKKNSSFKLTITQLNEKIQYLNMNILCLQDKSHELQEKLKDQESQIVDLKQMLMRNEKTIIDGKQVETRLCEIIQILKRQIKVLQQKGLELQLGLKSQQQTKEKYKSMLQQQQNKNKKVNEFINELIIEKQKVIKVSLQKSEQNNNLQNKIFQLNHHKQLLVEENAGLKAKIEINKQESKNYNKSIKNLQKEVSEQKLRCRQAMDKIKQKQNDNEIRKQYIKILEEKYQELLNKNYKETKELTNQLDDKDLATYNLKKQLNQQINKIETQNKFLWNQNSELKTELQRVHLQFTEDKNTIETLELQLHELKQEKNDYEDQCTSKQFLINSKLEEIKRLESLVDEQKIYIQRIQSQQTQIERHYSHNINELTNDSNFKMLMLQKQLQQKLEGANKQYKDLSQKYSQMEQKNKKLQMSKLSDDFQHEQKIKNYEQKLKMMQSDRYNTILQKNKELKLISQQSKNYFNKIKQKDVQIRKLILEVEQHKNIINKLQISNTHSQQNYNHKIMILQKEICSWKQKDVNSHTIKDRMNSILHLNQIEVRNIISQTIKRIIEDCPKFDSDRIYTLTKGLQSSVVSAMMSQLDKQ